MAAAFERALYSILEYMAEVYEPPSEVFKDKVPTVAGRKLDVRSDPYAIESETIFGYILRACGKQNKENPNNAGQLWKSKVNFAVSNQEDHEFW